MPPDAPAGHCPKCLVELALEAAAAETVLPARNGTAQSIGPQPVASAGLRVKYFGDYELIEEIGRGGMGVVWKARQASLRRLVALKMILAGEFARSEDVERFHTEAEAAANLQHPNIVVIHEVGEHQGQHYFSMDYVEGQSLAQRMRGGPMPPAQAAELVKTLAEAIHHAHQRGTLHRDLKPSNVLIDREGKPHITDFGLAKQMARESGLTQTGAALGTPAYMPPEQAAGRRAEIGPASDVYSLGAILFELVTGRAPFVAETAVATLQKVMADDPPAPSKVRAQVPADLETICLKCLEKSPERRYHSARELAEELGRFLAHEPILARPASAWRKGSSWAKRNPWAIVGAASVLGLVLLALAYGLWEQVRFLEWRAQDPARTFKRLGKIYDFSDVVRYHRLVGEGLASSQYYVGWHDPVVMVVVGWLILIPAALYGRYLKGRAADRPGHRLHLALLTTLGALLVGMGIWCDVLAIRLYVWMRPVNAWQSLLGGCLGAPLLFCWAGGLLVWQAARRQQAHWSGALEAGREWLPRQPVCYSGPAYLGATLVNLALFLGLAQIVVREGVYDDIFPAGVPATTHEGYVVMQIGFVMVAFFVSLAVWQFALRKAHRLPPPAAALIWVLFGGVALQWSSAPSRIALPPVLAGLFGGLLLVKTVRVRPAEQGSALAPIRLAEVFEWDAKALALASAVVLGGVIALAVLWFPRWAQPFLVAAGTSATWPVLFLATRATTGKTQEFFRALCLVLVPTGLALPALSHWFGLPPRLVAFMLAGLLAGLAAGCLVVYYGKIRARVS